MLYRTRIYFRAIIFAAILYFFYINFGFVQDPEVLQIFQDENSDTMT